MKKILFLNVLIIIIACLESSCTRYIVPALVGVNNIGYLPRPFVRDSAKSKTYISSEYSSNTTTNGYTNINLGILNISRAYANEYFNVSVGAFGFLGEASYNDTYIVSNATNPIFITDKFLKSFGGWGLRSTIGLHTISFNKHINFRIINWENAYSQEYGEYAKYRNSILENNILTNEDANTRISTMKNIFTTGFSSEIIFNEIFDNKDFSFSARAFLGATPKLENSYYVVSNGTSSPIKQGVSRSGIFIASFYFGFKKLFGTMQFGSGDHTKSTKLGLGYSF